MLRTLSEVMLVSSEGNWPVKLFMEIVRFSSLSNNPISTDDDQIAEPVGGI